MPAPMITTTSTDTEQSSRDIQEAPIAPAKPQLELLLAKVWQRVDTQALSFVTGIFVASRLLLLLATVIAAHISAPGIFNRTTPTPFWRTWFYWDSTYYAGIAHFGYRVASIQHTPAFFPLFPITERLLIPFTQGNYILAGLYSANIAWFVALYGLYRLARYDFGVTVARYVVIALSAFPTAFFGFVPYSESLFLALAIGAAYCMRQRKWGQAALWAMLASQTRLVGVLLVLPFLWEYGTYQWHVHALDGRQVDWRALPRRLGQANLLWVLLIPTGTLLYMLWLWHAVGDPLAFFHAEKSWHREMRFPLITLWDGMWFAIHAHGYLSFRGWQEFLIVIVMILVAILGIKVMPLSYSIFSLTFLMFALLDPQHDFPLESQSRYILELFPLFIILGVLAARRRWLLGAIILVGLPLQLVLLGIFSRHGWMT